MKKRYSPTWTRNPSRRTFLKACTATASLSIFGSTQSSEAVPRRQIAENSEGGLLQVNDDFTLFDNQWGNKDADQAVWVNADGSYGWDFDSTGPGDGINYPQVFIGIRPWGETTGVSEFPIQQKEVSQFVIDVDADYDIAGGQWNLAHEWWLLEQPDVEIDVPRYEVMLLLDWGGGHSHGTPVYTDLWTDEYGNTIDLWALYDSGGTSAMFYIFRVQGGHNGGKIDMKRIVDWLTSHEGISDDLWISGSELGNEYWPGATGRNTVAEFDVTINRSSYTSGVAQTDTHSPRQYD